MYIWICYAEGGGKRHSCAKALNAVREAGYDPEVRKAYGLGALPFALPINKTTGRKEAKEKTGDHHVPVLVLDDGSSVGGSDKIVAWAKAHPASGPTGS